MIDAIKKQDQRGAVIMAMAALPVVALGLFGSLSPGDRYWGAVYVVWGTVFAAFCVAATSRIVRRTGASDSRLMKKALCFGGMTAWGLSLPVLVLTTLTPLCLGKDNGDGRNNVAMCLFLAVVWFIVMSLPVCSAIALLAKWACNAVSASSCVETRRRDENSAIGGG